MRWPRSALERRYEEGASRIGASDAGSAPPPSERTPRRHRTRREADDNIPTCNRDGLPYDIGALSGSTVAFVDLPETSKARLKRLLAAAPKLLVSMAAGDSLRA